MTPRERTLTALRRKTPDRVPRELSYGFGGFTPEAYEKFLKHTDSTEPAEYFNYEIRSVSYPLPEKREDKYYRELGTNVFDKGVSFNSKYEKKYQQEMAISSGEWGIGVVRGGKGSRHFVKTVSPMKDFTSPDEVKAYNFPNLVTSDNFNHLLNGTKDLHERDLAVMGELYTTILETAESLRGLAQLFKDLYSNRKLATALFEKLTRLRCKQAEQYAEADIDVLRLGDDLGDQNGMLINPEIWRELLKPRLKRVIQSAKKIKKDILIFYHSDGDCSEVISDLIEVGVDILNPVQPEVLDPTTVKKRFGEHLSFWGTVGIQKTLPFGSPSEVKHVVKRRIETAGKGGGLLLAPAHVIEPEVPWENIVAFFEAIEEYGKYK